MRKLFYYLLRHFRIFEILSNQEQIKSQIRILAEIHKAQIFTSTIVDSDWLKYKSFSPGGWAVDYGFLYTLYRVLNGIKPQNILEFGLGQSSKMIHQYANYYNVKAITCEHDDNWIKFFNEGKDGKYNVSIKKVELENIEYKGQRTLSYKNVPGIFEKEKFDLILVDGPYGQEHYSRPQIIDLVQNNVPENFCILIDDYERVGEQETGKEIFDVLEKRDIKYCQRVYSAEKQHILICSENLKFLTTL